MPCSVGAFALGLLAVSGACITEDTVTQSRGVIAASESIRSSVGIRVEPFVDRRGMSVLGRSVPPLKALPPIPGI